MASRENAEKIIEKMFTNFQVWTKVCHAYDANGTKEGSMIEN